MGLEVTGAMPGMNSGLNVDDPTVVAAFRAALLHQGLIILAVFAVLSIAWVAVRRPQDHRLHDLPQLAADRLRGIGSRAGRVGELLDVDVEAERASALLESGGGRVHRAGFGSGRPSPPPVRVSRSAPPLASGTRPA